MLISALPTDALEAIARQLDAPSFVSLQASCRAFSQLDNTLVQRVWRAITITTMKDRMPWLEDDSPAAAAFDWKERYAILSRAGCPKAQSNERITIHELNEKYIFFLDGVGIDSLRGKAVAGSSVAEVRADQPDHQDVPDAIFLLFKGDAMGMFADSRVPLFELRRLHERPLYTVHVRRAVDGKVAHLATFDASNRDECYNVRVAEIGDGADGRVSAYQSARAGCGTEHYGLKPPLWLGLVSEAGEGIDACDGNSSLHVTAWPLPRDVAFTTDGKDDHTAWGQSGCCIELLKNTCNVPYIDHTNFMGAVDYSFPIKLREFPAVLHALEWA